LPLLLVVLLTFFLDQLSKTVIKSFMAEGQTISIIPHVFSLTYILNPGAAFGLLAYQTTFFVVMTLIVIVLVLLVAWRTSTHLWLLRLSLALILGGALGNLADRLRYGLVVDFLDFKVWPVFNLADSAIFIGAFLLVVEIWRSGWGTEGKEKRRT